MEFDIAELMTHGEWLLRPSGMLRISSVADDSRQVVPGALFMAVCGERTDGHRFVVAAARAGAAAVCVERPPSAGEVAVLGRCGCGVLRVANTLTAYHGVARAHRRRMNRCTVVGVTGSAGKTSVKEMLAAVCRHVAPGRVVATEGNTNNHFGVPRNLLRITEAHRYAILELGSNQPGDIRQLAGMIEPDIGVVTSIGKAHLEKLGSVEGVAEEKAEVIRSLPVGGIAIVPKDGPGAEVLMRAAGTRKVLTFGRTPEADVATDYCGWRGAGFGFRLRWQGPGRGENPWVEWSLGGAHQARNASAAAAVAVGLGLSPDVIVGGLTRTRLPGMRATVETHGGCIWVNDAYNANPDSMRAGIDLFAEVVAAKQARDQLVVLGDMLELGAGAVSEARRVLEYARKRLPDAQLIAVGPLMKEADTGVADALYPDAEAARPAVRDAAEPGAAVLLKGSRGMGLEAILPDDDTLA